MEVLFTTNSDVKINIHKKLYTFVVIFVLFGLQFTASDYPFGILWPLCCLVFNLRLLITPLVSCGHCVVCSSIYGFWLLLWYPVAIVLSVLLFTASDYSFDILWPLCCLFFYLRLLITPFVSSNNSKAVVIQQLGQM